MCKAFPPMLRLAHRWPSIPALVVSVARRCLLKTRRRCVRCCEPFRRLLNSAPPLRGRCIYRRRSWTSSLTHRATQRMSRRTKVGVGSGLCVHDRRGLTLCGATAKSIHDTIAQMMIFANSTVAKFIFDHFRDRALLRVHAKPDDANFGDMNTTAASKVCATLVWAPSSCVSMPCLSCAVVTCGRSTGCCHRRTVQGCARQLTQLVRASEGAGVESGQGVGSLGAQPGHTGDAGGAVRDPTAVAITSGRCTYRSVAACWTIAATWALVTSPAVNSSVTLAWDWTTTLTLRPPSDDMRTWLCVSTLRCRGCTFAGGS